jgi:hypothetical protein
MAAMLADRARAVLAAPQARFVALAIIVGELLAAGDASDRGAVAREAAIVRDARDRALAAIAKGFAARIGLARRAVMVGAARVAVDSAPVGGRKAAVGARAGGWRIGCVTARDEPHPEEGSRDHRLVHNGVGAIKTFSNETEAVAAWFVPLPSGQVSERSNLPA